MMDPSRDGKPKAKAPRHERRKIDKAKRKQEKKRKAPVPVKTEIGVDMMQHTLQTERAARMEALRTAAALKDHLRKSNAVKQAYREALGRIAKSDEPDLGVYAAMCEEIAREAIDYYEGQEAGHPRRHAITQANRLKVGRPGVEHGNPQPGDRWWRLAWRVEAVWDWIDGWVQRRIAGLKRIGQRKYMRAHPVSPEVQQAAKDIAEAEGTPIEHVEPTEIVMTPEGNPPGATTRGEDDQAHREQMNEAHEAPIPEIHVREVPKCDDRDG